MLVVDLNCCFCFGLPFLQKLLDLNKFKMLTCSAESTELGNVTFLKSEINSY